MTTNPRRRLRIREELPAPYVARIPEGESYQPPPPNPADDGPRESYLKPPERGLGMLTAGEAFLVYAASHADAVDAWRHLFPASSEVFDGVRTTEAGVIPMDQTFTLEGENDER